MATTMALPDGRTMGYALHGDPAAPPVLYCHGWPGSRLEIGLLADPPVRLIAPDRPGYGLSSPHPGQTFEGWARDVAALADHLGVARFRAVGVSAGAPHALALAAALPARVRAVALVNPVPPPGAATFGTVRHLFRLGRHPRAARAVLGGLRRLLRSGLMRHAHRVTRTLPASDRAALTPATTAALLAAWQDGVRPGIEGLLADAMRLARPWDFALHSIDAPVLVWHGAADTLVPAACTQAFRALPRVRIRIVADAGHYAVPLCDARAILAALASTG